MEAIAISSTRKITLAGVMRVLGRSQAVLALLLGALAFKASVLVPLSLLVLTLWANARSRWTAFLVGVSYFIGFTLAVPQAVCGYQDISIEQALITILLWWPCAAMIFALPFALFWSSGASIRIKAPLLLLTLLLPPFGVFGIGHPVLAAGAMFPGTGVSGIALVLMVSPLYATSYFWLPVALSGILSSLHYQYQPPSDPSIYALDTHLASTTTRTPTSLSNDWLKPGLLRAQLLDLPKSASIVVLPEEIAGVFTNELIARWSAVARETNKTLIVGGDSLISGKPVNTLLRFGRASSDILYTQRQPVPFSMWKPWSASAYPISFTADSVAFVEGKKLGFLLCYELLTPWTVIQTAIQHPDTIVGATNIAYARKTSLFELMELHRNLWSALFGIPIIIAHNR